MSNQQSNDQNIDIIINEAKKGYVGLYQDLECLDQSLELFESVVLQNDQHEKYPFTSFGAIMNEQDQILTVCCFISKNQVLSSSHSLVKYIESGNQDVCQKLKFVSFYNKEYSCPLVSVKYNQLFESVDKNQEYDIAIIQIAEDFGSKLGYLGILANAKSDDFDIQTASNPIILLGLNSNEMIEYQTTLAMDVTYNYLTVFNVINYDNIAFVNDCQYGYCVIGVSSKSTQRQTIINCINHEKIDLLHEWITTGSSSSLPISKARKYLENKGKLQSKLIVGIEREETEQDRAHSSGIKSIIRINNNCFGSVCEQGIVKVWNWKSGEMLQSMQVDENEEAKQMLKEVFVLQINGEFLICLAKSGFLYFNWLNHKLEKKIDHPLKINGEYDEATTQFTSICCLNNDIDILIGCNNGLVYKYSYTQEDKQYVFQGVLFDFSSTSQSCGVTCILQILQEDVVIGLNNGSVQYARGRDIINSVDLCGNLDQPIVKLLYFEEYSLIVSVAVDRFFVLKIDELPKPEASNNHYSSNQPNKSDNVQNNNALDSNVSNNNLESANKSATKLTKIRENITYNKINAVNAINELEMGLSCDKGFITGDDDGKIRIWIIGFNSAPTQPEQLDIIEELTEHSEKSNMLSHRSQQSLQNFQTNSSQQLDHNGYHSRPSVYSSHENSEQFISPKNEDRQNAIIFPKDQNEQQQGGDNQTQQSRKEQILRDVKSSFKKNSQNLIENQSIKIHLQNNKNDQILIQDSLEERNYYPESDKNEEIEDYNQDSEAERNNKSEILIRNQIMDQSPVAKRQNEQKRTYSNHLDTQTEYLNTQENSASQNQDSYYLQYQNNSEQNLNSQEQFEKLIDQSNQQITNQSNANLSPKDNFSNEKSPISQNNKNKVEKFSQAATIDSNKQDTTLLPTINNKVINLNLPPSLLKQIDYSNTFGQKPIITQKNEQSDNELEGESLPIQQTLNLFNQKNHQDQSQLAPPALNHQSNSQISQKSEDKNIFTQTVSRLINADNNQQLQNNSDVPAHRRLLSNTTHQSEDTSFENVNIQTNQIDSAHKSKQRIIDRKDSNEIKEDYQIVNNDQSNSKAGGSSSSSSNHKYSQDEATKQMMAGSGKFNSFKLNNLPSVLSNHIDESNESIIISQVGQEVKNEQKCNVINSQHKIRDMKEPEHNFEQLTKILNNSENNMKNEKQIMDLQKQVQNLNFHNNQLQRKVEELLNLNSKLQNDKQDCLKENESLKQEIQEIKKKPTKESQEAIKQMYNELSTKLIMLDKIKQDIVKNQNVNTLQKKIEDQQKYISDLKQQDQKRVETFQQALNKSAEESKVLKEKISQQQQEIQKLRQQEAQNMKRITQISEENSQFEIILKEKDKVIKNQIEQLKQQSDQIIFKLKPQISSNTTQDIIQNNNISSPQAQHGAKDILLNKILQLNSENEKLKNKIQSLEKHIQTLTKQVSHYQLDSKTNDMDLKDTIKQNEILIAFQKQKQETNANTCDQGSHRKAKSYMDFKQQPHENDNKSYEMTINLQRKQKELSELQSQKPEQKTIENIQNQQGKKYFFEERTQKYPTYQNERGTYQNERGTYNKSNLSMDLGNLFQSNQSNQVDPYYQSKTTQQNKKIILEQQLHEIHNKPFYTPNKSTSVSLSQNITNNSFSNNRLQNTSDSNNNQILNNISLNNMSLTPRALGQTQDSFTYYQTNTSTKFLQIPSQNKLVQQQQQYDKLSLSPSPQKTANPNYSYSKIAQNNLSINSPQQNSNFFNTIDNNSRISNPTTPQRPIANTIKSNQPYQQQQIISPQPNTITIIQNVNGHQQQNQPMQKKPIFDYSPQSRNYYGVIKTQNSDEKSNKVIDNLFPQYSDLKTQELNSFRIQDKEIDQTSRYLQNNQKRSMEDQTKQRQRQRKLIFSNHNITPPRSSLNTSLQSINNQMISNNLNLNTSYTAPFQMCDTYQRTNR